MDRVDLRKLLGANESLSYGCGSNETSELISPSESCSRAPAESLGGEAGAWLAGATSRNRYSKTGISVSSCVMFVVGSGSIMGVLASSSGNGAGKRGKKRVRAFATAAGRTTGLIRTLFSGRTTETTETSTSALSVVDSRRVGGWRQGVLKENKTKL